jgi:hypothetical protein
MFAEGELVSYKHIKGFIAFVCEHSVSILVSRGKHKSQDVKVVVYRSDFKDIFSLNSK